MFRALNDSERWGQYLANNVDGFLPQTKIKDPLGAIRSAHDIFIEEDDKGKLLAVLGQYDIGSIECCFYAVPLSKLHCQRGRIMNYGFDPQLDMYWFELAWDPIKHLEYTVVNWASSNKHLFKNIEFYTDVSLALYGSGYAAFVEDSNWIIQEFQNSDSPQFMIHKVMVRKKYHTPSETVEALHVASDTDDGGLLLQVSKITEFGGKILEYLEIPYPTQNLQVPRWELVHSRAD